MIVAIIALSGLAGCSTPPRCIVPPVEKTDASYKTSMEIVAKLEKLPAQGDLKLGFEKTLHEDFGKLSERNASLYLFLQAIHCYLERGEAGKELAKSMAATTREWWRESAGMKSPPSPGLSGSDRRLIDATPDLSKRIYELHDRIFASP